MTSNDDRLLALAAVLREKAETCLLDQSVHRAAPLCDRPPEALHELELHQIELELQNDELRHTQQLLDKSLKRYVDLYDLAPVGYCMVNAAGLILEANLRLASMLGLAANTLIDRSFYQFIDEEDKDQFYLLAKKAYGNLTVEKSDPCSCSVRLLSIHQPLCWVKLTATSVAGEDGTSVLHLAVTDITAAKRAEIALKRQTELLDITGKLAKVGGWEVHLETMKLSWTRETFRIAEIDSMIEQPLEEGINLFAPEARPTIAAAVQAAIETGTPYDLELPLITAKGRHLWVQTQGFAEMVNGKAVRIYGTFQDITARKHAELFHANVMDSVSDHIAVLDDQGIILSVNLAWKKFAIENGAPWLAEHSIGLNYLTVCTNSVGSPSGDKAESVCAGLRAVLAGQQNQFEMEYPCHSPEEQRWFLLTITRLSGAKPGAVIAHKNISGRIRAEAEQRNLQVEIVAQRAELVQTLNRMSDAVITVDLAGKLLT